MIEGDWGYILVLPPILPKEKEEEIVLIIIEGIDAYSIVRSKKISSQFLLQIVPTYYDKKYDIFFYRVKDDPLYKGTKAYVMNIIDRSK